MKKAVALLFCFSLITVFFFLCRKLLPANRYEMSPAQEESVTLTEGDFRLNIPENTEDMTETIQSKLDQYGVFELPPGEFHVTGLIIPPSGTLRGNGNATKLILEEKVEDGAAIELSSESCVRDLQIIGSETRPDLQMTVGSRHGILFEGNADAGGECPVHATIENVSFHNLTGGAIVCQNTGYSVDASINVINCCITDCGVGIFIPFWSEYNRFTNISVTQCEYGCINNGGNNMFVNCSFSSNRVGLLMDNSDGKARNNSHGSFLGCSFNHSGGNEGYAIVIQGMSNGEIFSGCQIFFGKTLIQNCEGIYFIGSNMGRKTDIIVRDSSAIFFTDCIITNKEETPVTLENSESVSFHNCYCHDGTPFS